MTDASIATSTAASPDSSGAPPLWTCPFCPLLCDTFSVRPQADGGAYELVGSDCPKAAKALRYVSVAAASATPLVDAVAADLDAAVAAAARLLAASRQPLFGGLATDVAGARALYRLACRTGAITDHAGGAALMRSTRALQDKGAFTTTLAEINARADLIVCVGSDPTHAYPEFFNRCGVGATAEASGNVPRRIVFLGDAPPPPALAARPNCTVDHLPLVGDLYDTVAALSACVAKRTVRDLPPAIATLAGDLAAATYAVIVWETAALPAHGGVIVEALNRIVSTLNRKLRAAAYALGGGDGGGSVNQVVNWLSGLPLRSRAGPSGLEHEPYTFDTGRLLEGRAVDALLWISSYGPEPGLPATPLPTVVLGHPAMAAAHSGAGVFIPVATPGIDSAGHLFRADSSVLMPLHAVRDGGLPTVADVLARIDAALVQLTAEATV